MEMDASQLQQVIKLQAELKREVSKILTAEAMRRLSSVRAIKPELALQAELYLVQAHQAGQIKGPLSDEQLKSVLGMFTAKKEGKTRIIRK